MSYLKGKRGYLSGPIEHDNSINWRCEPKLVFTEQFGIDVFDPFEDPKQQCVDELLAAKERCDYDTMRTIAKSFVRKDLSLVDRSDLLIAYLPYKVPTTGTIHEIINSNNAKKPTLLVADGHKKNLPLWLYGFIPQEAMFNNWDELYTYLREVDQGLHKENSRWAYIYGLI